MEFNFKSSSPYSYLKYGDYCGKYKGEDYYMVPNPQSMINFRNIYDVFNKIEQAVVDLLNMGRSLEDDDREMTKFTFALFFVEQYGLLGFMAEAPVNPDFLLNKDVILKKGNFITKSCTMKTSDYFDLFFPFCTKEEMSYSVADNKVKINTNSDLQKMLEETSISNQLIYSTFYCEKIDWIVAYAKKMYKLYTSINSYNEDRLSDVFEKDIIDDFKVSGVPYRINMEGNKPEIAWQPNSLKQAIDMSFGFMMSSEKNPIRQCKHCGKVFLAKNPKAEYCRAECRNKANVYKSRAKNKE